MRQHARAGTSRTIALVGAVAVLAATFLPVGPAGSAEPAATPVFSHDRGFYDAPIAVTITSATPGVQIRYTTTGKAPTASFGTVYTGPVPISKPTVLRAIAYRAGLADSPVESRTYIFPAEVLKQPALVPGYGRPFYPNATQHDYGMDQAIVNNPAYSGIAGPALKSIPTVSIAVDPADIMRNGRLGEVPLWGAYGFYDGYDVRKPMSAELIDPAHPGSNGAVLGMVQGHAEPKLKRSMQLRFSKDNGPGWPSKWTTDLFRNAPLNGASAAPNAKSVILRAGYNAGWANLSEPTAYTEDQFFRDTQIAGSGYGARGTFVHVYVNGLYWGMYNAVEKPDEHWQAEYFGGDDDDWFSFDEDGQVDWDGDPARFRHVTEDLVNRDMSDPANYEEMKQYLDVEGLADYLAIEFYIQNADWPDNNWRGGNRNSPAEPVRWFAWDGDAIWWSSGAWVPPAFQPGAAPSTSPLPRLWHALRVNPDFMATFADRVHRLTTDGGALADGPALARWDALNAFVRDAMVDESARWGDALRIFGVPTRTRDRDWQLEVNRIRSLIVGNGNRLVSALRGAGYFPAINAPTVDPNGGIAAPGAIATITNPNPGGTVYYTVDGSDPRGPGGTLAPTALAYSGPVAVSSPTRLRARVLDGGSTWSAIADASWREGEVAPLRVTELMYNPLPAGGKAADDLEFVEIRNVGTAPVDLAGIKFTAGITFDFTGASVRTLEPGGLLVVARNPAAFTSVYGAVGPVVGPYSGKLANEGELVRLSDAGGRTVQEFTYSDQWYPTTDGGGYSLTVRDPGAPVSAWSTPGGWRPSSSPSGTPGAGDDLPVVAVDPLRLDEGDSGTTQAVFRVSVDRPVVAPVTVAYQTTDGSAVAPADYTSASGDLTFTPGGPTEAFVTVDVIGDTVAETDETFDLRLSLSGGSAVVSGGTAAIVNDDAFARVSVADASTTEGTGGTRPMVFPVSLDREVASPARVNYRTRDMTATSADYDAKTGTLEFLPGEATSQNVVVTVQGDSVREATEQFELLLSDPVGVEVERDRAVGTVVDDDAPTIVATATGKATFEDTSGKRYELTLNIPAKVDLLGNRGTVSFSGAGAPTDGQYAGRNTVGPCGAACVAGSAWAWFKPTLYWRVDNSTVPATITVGGRSGRVVSGAITVTYVP